MPISRDSNGPEQGVPVSEAFDWKAIRPAQGRVLHLTPGAVGRVHGRIEGYTDPAEVGATNMTLPDAVQTEFKAVTSNSTFAFDKLPPGDYLILVTTPDFFGKATNIEVNASQEIQVTIMQEAGNQPS